MDLHDSQQKPMYLSKETPTYLLNPTYADTVVQICGLSIKLQNYCWFIRGKQRYGEVKWVVPSQTVMKWQGQKYIQGQDFSENTVFPLYKYFTQITSLEPKFVFIVMDIWDKVEK